MRSNCSSDGSCDGSDGGVTSGGVGVGDSGAVADEFGWVLQCNFRNFTLHLVVLIS